MVPVEVEFQILLKEISDELGSDDIKTLKFILRPYPEMKKINLEKADSGVDIFKLMEEAGLLSFPKIGFLTKILRDSKLGLLVDKVVKFQKTHPYVCSHGESTKGIDFSDVCNILPELIVKHFIKTDTLNVLEDKMKEKDYVTLYGLLGSGKSQLALKYGRMFKEQNKRSVCWRMSCQDEDKFLNSMKKLADQLGLKDASKQDESKSVDESVNDIKELIIKNLSLSPGLQHLFIFDDVTDNTMDTVDEIIRSLLNRNLSVKIIVTSWTASYPDDRELIQVKGFTEKEAVEFLCQKPNPTEKDMKCYRELALELSCLPLALYGAKTYMKSCFISPSRFNRNMKEVKSIAEIEKLVSPKSENKKLFTVIMKFLQILKKDEEIVVFDKILSLQFLETDDIPVLLFDFFPSDDNMHESFSTDKFIQALQKFSFGFFRGEDDERYISTHSAVIKTIEKFTGFEEKKRIIKKLLKSFMWLMDKDNYAEKDYNRNQTLLPHAISTLHHAQKLLKEKSELSNDLEFYIPFIYINDVVGYTYNFFGILYNAGQYSSEARKSCFVLLGVSEENIMSKIDETVTRTNDYKVWQEYARMEANIIDKYLTERIQNELKVLHEFACSYILNKHRSIKQIETLEEFLGHQLEKEYFLTKEEYENLISQQLAIPMDDRDLGSIFLFELILQVLYTYGRRMFYLSDSVESCIVQDFAYSLFLAREFGQIASAKFPKWNLLYTLLTEISGTLEQQLDDKAGLNQRTIENSERAVKRFEVILEEDSKYYIFGVVRVHSKTSSILQTRKQCYKRILHCYTSMNSQGLEESKKKEICLSGERYTKKLEELIDLGKSREASYYYQAAGFKMFKGDYDGAEEALKKIVPEDIWNESETIGKESIKDKELLASKLLIPCLVDSDKKHEARRIFHRLKSRLENSKQEIELSLCIELAEKLKLS